MLAASILFILPNNIGYGQWSIDPRPTTCNLFTNSDRYVGIGPFGTGLTPVYPIAKLHLFLPLSGYSGLCGNDLRNSILLETKIDANCTAYGELGVARDSMDLLYFTKITNSSPGAIYMSNTNDLTLGRYILLEYLLAQSFVLENYDSSTKYILLDSCLTKLNNRLADSSFLTPKSIVSSSYLMIRLLSYLDNNLYTTIIDENQDIKYFSESSQDPPEATLTKIINYIVDYLN